MIDEARGWVLCAIWNQMADPGDGSVHREINWTKLHYAGDGKFSYEEDIYNPSEFAAMIKGWLATKTAPGEQSGVDRQMEFGIFNSLYVPKRTYEHEADQWAVESQRLQNEIDVDDRGRPRRASSTRGRRSTTSSPSTRTCRRTSASSPTSRRDRSRSTSAPASSTSRRR